MKQTGDARIDEIMPPLSERWSLLPFEECIRPIEAHYHKLKSKQILPRGAVPVIDQGEQFISGYTNNAENKFCGPLPVILFGDHTRRFKYIDFEFAVGAEGIKPLYPVEQVDPRFFYHYLRSLKLEAQGYSRHYRFLKCVYVPVPPLSEQDRIVVTLEKLLAKVDSCRERLEKIPAILKRFRQSVLAAACSGRLTADWRESNPEVEPAPELVLRINAARAAHKPTSGTVGLSAKPLLVEFLREPDHPNGTLPDMWIWVRFGTIIGELRNGVPLRPNIEPPGVPILRISATRPGVVDLADVRYMPKGEMFLPLYALKNSDLLFTRYNGSIELLGVCGMVRGLGEGNILYPDKLMRVRFDHAFVLPAFAEIFFQASEVRERVLAKSKSSAGQNGVSGSDIKAQAFALAPLPEQHEIVRRAEALFALADLIEARYHKAKAHVDKLTQSILAKAFRGELVPQDPNDEPASKLLERIRSETTEKRPQSRNKKRV